MPKRKMSKQEVEALSILINPYPYIEDSYNEDVEFFTRQIEQYGSIKLDEPNVLSEIEDRIEDFDFSWNK